jgi:hypothetical protein
LLLFLLLLLSWALWGGPLDAARSMAVVRLVATDPRGSSAMGSSLGQAAGALAGFAVTIVVLLVTMSDSSDYVSRASGFRYGRQVVSDAQREQLAESVLFVRDMAVSMLTVAFFGFIVAILGFSIAVSRSDGLSATVVYSFAACSFYVALLLFFGALVPLFRLVRFQLPVTYARVLFIAATVMGGFWLVATARAATGVPYQLSWRVVVFIAAGGILPLYTVSAFSHVTFRRRTCPELGLWLAVAQVIFVAMAEVAVPKVVSGLGTSVLLAQLTFAGVGLSIALAVGWAMFLGSMDPDSQPVFFTSVAAVVACGPKENRDVFSFSLRGFTTEEPQCPFAGTGELATLSTCGCEGSLLLEQTVDQHTLPSRGLAPYLAVYRTLFHAADHTHGTVLCIVEDPHIARRLNDVVAGDARRYGSLRVRLVLNSIERASHRLGGVRFVSSVEGCQVRAETARRLVGLGPDLEATR